MQGKFYIKKFIRDDGATLDFDGREILLDVENTLLVRSDPSTTAVSYTESNGGEMIRQRLGTAEQTVNGLILPIDASYWELVQRLTGFWQINHTYRIVYIKRDGGLFAISNVWISSALQVIPTPYETYSKWKIGLTVGNELWLEYAEDASGKEIFANVIVLPSLTSSSGGEDWDEAGEVYDDVGAVWLDDDSGSGLQKVVFNSIKPIYPVWEVSGPCTNPHIQNNTSDTEAIFEGTVAEGQTLIVNFETGEAHLDGALVSRLVNGTLICSPGENLIGFGIDGGSTKSSTISWNNVIG